MMSHPRGLGVLISAGDSNHLRSEIQNLVFRIVEPLRLPAATPGPRVPSGAPRVRAAGSGIEFSAAYEWAVADWVRCGSGLVALSVVDDGG
ncbi:MAG: hypothetical protein U9R47_01650, partial [Actinomycetota bacterium]|nr:hypothetical protein [Actinomycetota bacterium]